MDMSVGLKLGDVHTSTVKRQKTNKCTVRTYTLYFTIVTISDVRIVYTSDCEKDESTQHLLNAIWIDSYGEIHEN